MRYQRTLGAAVPALVLGGLLAFPNAILAHDVIFQAHGTGIKGTIKVGEITKSVLINDNDLSCKGLPKEYNVSYVATPKPIYSRVKTITTYTLGVQDQADGRAYLEDFRLELPGVTITALAVGTWAQARCDRTTGTESATGGADFVNVVINGNPITITGAPGQTVGVQDIATVTFDERTVWKSEYKSNAIHVKLFNASQAAYGDVYIGYSRAKITCDL